jgi:hypothetical protein
MKKGIRELGGLLLIGSLSFGLWRLDYYLKKTAGPRARRPTKTASPPATPYGSGRAEIKLDDVPGGIAQTTRNLYVIFDGSESMNGALGSGCTGDRSFRSKLEGARWALFAFIEQVPADVNLGLYVFDARGRKEVVPLGSGNRDAFRSAVRAVQSDGKTPLGEAIKTGVDRLVQQYKQQLGYGEFRLAVVTDGEANGEVPLTEAAEYAAKFATPIYTIGLCIGADHELRKYSVSYRAADSFEELREGLAETLAEPPSFDATGFAGSK